MMTIPPFLKWKYQMLKDIEERLKEAYKNLADHTRPVCMNECGLSYRCKWLSRHWQYNCCEIFYCEAAKEFAKKNWDTDLIETEEYKLGKIPLPFMGSNGCTVEPHMRPSCTIHSCTINSIGLRHGHPEWTKKYYDLREQINELEMERYKCKQLILKEKGLPYDEEILNSKIVE